MKLFGMKDRSVKKKFIETMFLFSVLMMTIFSGCSKKVHVAAVIRPNSEELAIERTEALKQLNILAEKAKEEAAAKGKKKTSFNWPETILEKGVLPSVDSVNNLFNQIEEELGKKKDIRLVDRSRIDRVLEQHAFEQSSWSDDGKIAEVGKALNADMLIFLEKGVFYPISDEMMRVRVVFFDVNTFRTNTVTVEKEAEGYVTYLFASDSDLEKSRNLTKASIKKLKELKLDY